MKSIWQRGSTMRLIMTLTTFAATVASAQWLNFPTPNVPRTKDGRLNLSAPAPRTADGKPDLSGLWEPDGAPLKGSQLPGDGAGKVEPLFFDIGVTTKEGLPLQGWAADLIKARRDAENKDDPDARCQPLGAIKMHLHPYPRKMLQLPGLLVILFERDTAYRQIFLDGRPLPVDPQPSYNGYSTGKWFGDTLVVETTGFKDGLWLDVTGTPLTDQAKITERFRRPSFGKLEIEITVADLKAYTKPWTIRVTQSLAVDTELLEFVCLENERDSVHLLGK